jgi:hypothetical protein
MGIREWVDQHPVSAVIAGSVVFVGSLMIAAAFSDRAQLSAHQDEAQKASQNVRLSAAEATKQFDELMEPV